MKQRKPVIRHLVCLLMVIAIAALIGCAGKQAVVKTDEGVILRYKAPEGQVLSYEKTETATQNMKVMNQAMDTKTEKTTTFKVESMGLEDGNHSLVITIESMAADLQTPQGQFAADTEPVIGKSFDMMLSVRGAESGLDDAEGIEYSMGMAGMRSIKPDFEAFFPDLPEQRVKIWDTWPSADTITIKDSGMDVKIISENLNVLEGFETINGRECAKVTADVVGSVTGEGMQGGANLEFEGEMTGKDVWYFDYTEGVLVKSSSDISVNATVNVTGPQEMTIPVTQTMSITADLIE
jgi:hypothetical protein